MKTPINTENVKFIEHNGTPVAVVLPYEDYMRLLHPELEGPMTPQDVISRRFIDGKSLIQSWREHLGLTQTEVAERLGVTQPAYQQMEQKSARPRKTTRRKIAEVFGIDPKLLDL